MAISALTKWEVRTTGNNNNGGGFVTGASGVDYSQQDSAQITRTDIVLATSTTMTSVSTAFTSNEVGNLIHITAGTGFTTGWYEITSVTTGTATVDRSAGTGGSTGGTGYVGGASATLTNIVGAVVAGNVIYVKSGTYAETFSPSVSGTIAVPIKWIGYDTSRTSTPTGTNRPLIDGGSSRSNCIAGSASYNWFENIRCANATGVGINQSGSNTVFVNVKSSSNSSHGFDSGSSATFVACESGSNGSAGFKSFSQSPRYFFCYSHDNTGMGFQGQGGSFYNFLVSNSIADSNADNGFYIGTMSSAVNSIAYNNTGGSSDGFQWDGDSLMSPMINNISMNNGRYGFNRASASADTETFFDYNIYYGNGTAGLNNITAGLYDLTSDPLFTNAASGDFTFQSSSPALSAALTVNNTGVTGTYKLNIGVDQDDNTAAGGGLLTNPGMGGGMHG